MYNENDVFQEALNYFEGDELAANVWISKYALRDNSGNLLEKTPADMHERLASEFARIEEKFGGDGALTKEKVFALLDRFKYIVPQGSPMYGIGNNYRNVSLSNCVVVDSPKDDMSSIMESAKELANLYKRRCVSEDSFIVVDGKGLVKMKDLNVGDSVLSYSINNNRSEFKKVLNKFSTEVKPDNRIIVTLSDGTQLKTSKLHPVLVFDQSLCEYKYIDAGNLKEGEVLIRPEYKEGSYDGFSKEQCDSTYPLSSKEVNSIIESYNDNYKNKIGGDNVAAITSYLRKNGRGIGEAAIEAYLSANIISLKKATEIRQRVTVKSVKLDHETTSYFDIEVEDNNNFYAGNNGLVNIHNCGVGVDISNLRPDGAPVNNSAMSSTGAWSFADLYSYVTRMVGQCIAKDQKVLTKRGLVEIQNIVPSEDYVWTKVGWVVVDKLLNNGSKKIYKLTTKAGYEVKTSADHVFMKVGADGDLYEEKLKNIKSGDFVSLIPGTSGNSEGYVKLSPLNYTKDLYNNSNRLNESVTQPAQLKEDLAYTLGYAYGDGNIGFQKNGKISNLSLACSDDYPSIKSLLKTNIKRSFNYDVSTRAGDGKLERLDINSRIILDWLSHNKILKEKTGDIKMPENIWQSPASVKVAFLSGYFDADGFASGSKKGYVFSSINSSFLKDVQLILMSLGIASKIDKEDRSDKGWSDLWSLRVVGKSAQEKFLKYFASTSVKVEQVLHVSERDCWLTPYKAAALNVSYNKYNYIPDNSQYISAQAFEKLSAETDEFFGNLLLRDEVVSIEEAGMCETYDLSLPKEHLFFCQGFQVHNSGRRGALMVTIDVTHPDIEKFITMKHDLTKVTGANVSVRFTDEFMNAVVADEDFQLKWPCESDTPQITRTVRALDIWNLICDSATKTAEPGLMMWDNIINTLPAHCYPGFKTLTTNPCFSGDTLIAVADGRNAVSIESLAAEGKDVPVYSVDKATGEVSIKWGRNPRVTGYNQKLLKITLDDGSSFSVTPNHKIPLLTGEVKEAKDLVSGDSLHRLTKRAEFMNQGSESQYYRFNCNTLNNRKDRIFEHKLISQFYEPEVWNQKYNQEKSSGWHKGGLVVHHKDYNSLNNRPENLELMTFKEHNQYHASHDTQGRKNGKYSGLTNKQIEQVALSLTKRLGRRFSKKDWHRDCEATGCPKSFSGWRSKGWYKTPVELARWAAIELGLENVATDPRLVKTYQRAISEGYNARIANSQVLVSKKCEQCGSEFEVDYWKREIAYCSNACALASLNSKKDMHVARVAKTVAAYKSKQEKQMLEQARTFSNLKFELGRQPKVKEWENACKENNISFRLRTKYGFQNYKEVVSAGNEFNHKVVSVEEVEGDHTVYNITVDDNHTVGLVTSKKENKYGNMGFEGVYVMQCGEIPLSAGDSCRLISQNLKHYVFNPFTPEAYFDFDLFSEHVRYTMRLCDDLAELELEKLSAIIDSCDSEDEKKLFEKLYAACENGRRTGSGTHGLADALARLCLRYDSEEAIELTEKIYEIRKIESYKESVNLAKERGAFPVFNWELEKDNIFIQSLPEDLLEEMVKVGRRNISILTNAPTGSVSIESQTSSGLEPVFRHGYTRRKKINPGDKDARVDFTDDLGDKWQEFTVYHKNAEEYLELFPKKKKLPDFFVDSEQINWPKRVDIQAAIQRHVDHSISSTINLPAGTSSSVVSELYLEGWRKGLKGLTVYVDGSRSGVLVTNESKKEADSGDFEYRDAAKRPDELPCDIHSVKVKGEHWTILVGLMDGKPYEVFGGLSEMIEIPKKYGEGTLIKAVRSKTKSRYDLRFGEDGLIKDVTKVFDNPTYQVHTRMVSLALRHGTRPSFLVEQLQKDPDNDLTSFSKVLSRVLKKYIEDGTKVASTDKICPACGAEDSLVYQEGCMSCESCGWTKCL